MDEYVTVLCVMTPGFSRAFKTFEGYLSFVDSVVPKSGMMNLARIVSAAPEYLKKWMIPKHFMITEEIFITLFSTHLIMYESFIIDGNSLLTPMPPRLCCFIEKLKVMVANYSEIVDLSNLTFCKNNNFCSIALYMDDIFEVSRNNYACRSENIERIVAELHPINVQVKDVIEILRKIIKEKNIQSDFSDDDEEVPDLVENYDT